jgi:PAT family beta-lactamase induction signal transducer AmpG
MDVGFTKTQIGLVAKAVLSTSSIVGAVLGGVWMIRLGLLRSMLLFGVLQAFSNLLYYALALTGKSFPLMIAATAIDNVAGAMGNIFRRLVRPVRRAGAPSITPLPALLPRAWPRGPAG